MPVEIQSFAKINLGLQIGGLRADGFHELRTVYQTVALSDVVRVSVRPGSGIHISCRNAEVPTDFHNTCFRTVSLALRSLRIRRRVVIEIEKRLPVKGGLGGASSNAVAALLAFERATGTRLAPARRLQIAAEVGSDLPLFLIGGTVLGLGRGEEVYPLPDLPALWCVIALPKIAISTPGAFADWDRWMAQRHQSRPRGRSTAARHSGRRPHPVGGQAKRKLTPLGHSDKMMMFHHDISAWLNAEWLKPRRSGVSAQGGGRAENLLLDLVRTGIENDFEQVVFPQHPEICEVKRVLAGSGSSYASLSGSGSALYGLFLSRAQARGAVKNLEEKGIEAVVTRTLPRAKYWNALWSTSTQKF
ncbi:MAG: 4-(cytidine 5'-diphospho)-2-C-methyl-D-erythritol kinase [Acidobacteria bacterium]|nr:4-(cytidine 5'-diphospho)-2-C-methyl-D-erythritol kinase [Acidobacteriota bacterium]